MAAITSAGVGSGLDIESLITKLVSAEGAPKTLRLNKEEAGLQSDLSAFGNLKSGLSQFQTAVQGLDTSYDFKARKATSSNEDLFTVTAANSAVIGNYAIKVDSLAQADKLHSGDFSNSTQLVGAGSLAINLGSDSFNITTTATTTLADLRDAINDASDNPGVSAYLLKVDSGTQLVLSSNKVGAANTIGIVATDTDGADGHDLTQFNTAHFTPIQSAQDSVVYIDGQKVTSAGNTLDTAISGVTLTLKKADNTVTGTAAVSLDKDAIKANVTKFVSAYNGLATTLTSLAGYNKETKTGGPLFGDAAVRGLQSQLRQILVTPVSASLTYPSLAEIGITTNNKGQLEVDSTKLDKVINADSEAVSKLFTSTDGVAKNFNTLANSYLASTGSLTTRVDGLNKQIDDISDQRNRLNTRLTNLEASYRKQYSALDSLLGQLQQTSSFLSQQLSSLASISNSN
jgi:flagellar hook-associated protein 2